MTPSALRAVAAVGHTPPLGLYDDSRADPSPPPPPLALLPQLDGHPQVQQNTQP